jgi:hypothetical protein
MWSLLRDYEAGNLQGLDAFHELENDCGGNNGCVRAKYESLGLDKTLGTLVTLWYEVKDKRALCPSDDYRGEVFCVTKDRCIYPVRAALPVYPDVYPHMPKQVKQSKKEKQSKQAKDLDMTFNLAPAQWSRDLPPNVLYAMTEKSDGSLMNLTFVPHGTPVYDALEGLPSIVRPQGCWILGSKFVFATSGTLLDDFIRVICTLYRNVDAFLERALCAFDANASTPTTLLFELILAEESPFLTAKYHAPRLDFLGTIWYDPITAVKHHRLPQPSDSSVFLHTALPTRVLDTWTAVCEHYTEQGHAILAAPLTQHVEIEGFVVYALDPQSHEVITARKLKYWWYLVAHRAHHPRNAAWSSWLEHAPMFQTLKHRIQNHQIPSDALALTIAVPLARLIELASALWARTQNKKDWVDYAASKEATDAYAELRSKICDGNHHTCAPARGLSLFMQMHGWMEQGLNGSLLQERVIQWLQGH